MLTKNFQRLLSFASIRSFDSQCFVSAIQTKSIPQKINLFQRACISTSPIDNESKELDQEIYTLKNPFRYIKQALRVLSKMRRIDSEFDEYDFMEGTKQAIVFVSDRLADGKFEEIEHLLTANGMDSLKKIFEENNPKTAKLRVLPRDVIVIVPTSVLVEEEDSNRKFVYALVDCCCEGPRIITSSFCREYTTSGESSWLIDEMEYKR